MISPDGRWVAAVRFTYATPDEAERMTLVAARRRHRRAAELAAATDRRPDHLVWGPDASTLFFTADDEGHHSAYRVDLPDGRVTPAHGGRRGQRPLPDPRRRDDLRPPVVVCAIRRRVVRFDARTADQAPHAAREPHRRARDLRARRRRAAQSRPPRTGTPLGAWLLRPPSAAADAPAPLVVFVHGGPLGSWNAWHWRWNPHILVERGYAVLLPDPALSTGYGQHMLDRGWGQWGGTPYTDIIALTDVALARPDIDGDTVALMGGSYGGYMANWVAGHTDRFKAHRHPRLAVGAARVPRDDRPRAGAGSTRWATRTWTLRATSTLAARVPAAMAESKTPMLVIHGEKDHRVPISEALHPVDRHAAPRRPRPVPVLPGREPLGPQAAERAALVRDGPLVPRRAPAWDPVRARPAPRRVGGASGAEHALGAVGDERLEARHDRPRVRHRGDLAGHPACALP